MKTSRRKYKKCGWNRSKRRNKWQERRGIKKGMTRIRKEEYERNGQDMTKGRRRKRR
jgi:hypothetical protein